MICGDPELTPIEKSGTTIPNYLRKRSWKSYYMGMNAITSEMRAYPHVDYRYLFQQKEGTSGTDELLFNNATTWPLQVSGREQAKEVIACGKACQNFGNLTDFVDQTKDMDLESPEYEISFTAFLKSKLGL